MLISKFKSNIRTEYRIKWKLFKGFSREGMVIATSDSDSKNKAVYEQICVNSDFIIHSSCNDSSTCQTPNANYDIISDREYWLHKSDYVRPLLQSSDSHSLEGDWNEV